MCVLWGQEGLTSTTTRHTGSRPPLKVQERLCGIEREERGRGNIIKFKGKRSCRQTPQNPHVECTQPVAIQPSVPSEGPEPQGRRTQMQAGTNPPLPSLPCQEYYLLFFARIGTKIIFF